MADIIPGCVELWQPWAGEKAFLSFLNKDLAAPILLLNNSERIGTWTPEISSW
jgi:hypothetical protein